MSDEPKTVPFYVVLLALPAGGLVAMFALQRWGIVAGLALSVGAAVGLGLVVFWLLRR